MSRMLPATLLSVALAAGCAGSGAAPAAPSPAPATSSSAPSTEVPSAAPAAKPEAEITASVRAAVAAADRSDDDKALDTGRKPDQMLAFFGVAPGARVAELGAGGGYTTELIARVVGPSGKVYAQNSRFVLERFAEKPWSDRLKKPVMAVVERVDRELDDPLPPSAKELDAVVIVLFYHDSVWLKTDRDRMNRAVFAALKPGGVYGIVDHSARDGAGVSEVQTVHRIEEKVVKEEVLRAGFVLDGEATFLKNTADARDWNASPREAGERRGTSDRFVLRFKKAAPAH